MLWRAKPVETSRLIRPTGIFEIGGASSEGVRSCRKPDGIYQIGGGFHHDDQIRAPSDGETEAIRPDPEGGTGGLHPWIP